MKWRVRIRAAISSGLLSGPVNKTFFGAIARPLHAAAARSNHCHTYSIFCSTNWTPKHTHKRIAAQQWYLNTPTSWHLTPGLYDFAGPRRISASVSTAILDRGDVMAGPGHHATPRSPSRPHRWTARPSVAARLPTPRELIHNSVTRLLKGGRRLGTATLAPGAGPTRATNFSGF